MALEIDAQVEGIHREGFCILPQHLPQELMEECNQAFLPIVRQFHAEHADNPNRGPCRHYIPLKLEPPFYDRRIFDDDAIVAILQVVLGEDMSMDQYASDTPLKGSVYQDVHADIGSLFDEEPEMWHPPAVIAVNFPFVDVPPERGPFEVARGSHLLPKSEALAKIEAGEIPLEPLLFEAGDVLIRDPRCLHRGSPNRTDTPRGAAVIGCHRGWFRRERNQESGVMPKAVWQGLSKRERRHLRHYEKWVE